MPKAKNDTEQLLRLCNRILNLYQDIEDVFLEIKKIPKRKLDQRTKTTLEAMKIANGMVGKLVVTILPG